MHSTPAAVPRTDAHAQTRHRDKLSVEGVQADPLALVNANEEQLCEFFGELLDDPKDVGEAVKFALAYRHVYEAATAEAYKGKREVTGWRTAARRRHAGRMPALPGTSTSPARGEGGGAGEMARVLNQHLRQERRDSR